MIQTHASVFRLLQTRARSLAEMAEAAAVSLPTLRRTVRDLVDHRWISQNGQINATGGRPAGLYTVDDAVHCIVGVHLQLPGIKLALVDLAGQVLHEREITSYVTLSPDDALKEITAYVSEVRAQFAERLLLGIGVAAPGFIDPASGEILTVGRVAGWGHFPVKARLESSLGLPVVVENDVDSMAIVELRRRDIPPETDLIYLGFDEGFKASLFLGGQRYRGRYGNAGNIGNMIVCRPAPQDGVTTIQVEKVISLRAVCRTYERRAAEGDTADPIHAAIRASADRREMFQAIMQAAEQGDPLCRAIVAEMIALFAVVVANLLNTIQPSLLIVGGTLSEMPPGLFGQLETQVRAYLPSIISNYLVIQRAHVRSETAVVTGIAYEFLEQFTAVDGFYQVLGDTI